MRPKDGEVVASGRADTRDNAKRQALMAAGSLARDINHGMVEASARWLT